MRLDGVAVPTPDGRHSDVVSESEQGLSRNGCTGDRTSFGSSL